MPTISILLTYSKNKFFDQTLSTILNQTYRDFELVVFSCDSNVETVDSRMIVTPTTFEEAVKKIDSKFIWVPGNIDLINHHYLELLTTQLANNNADIVYSNGAFINQANKRTDIIIKNPAGIYTKSPGENFYDLMTYRITVPIIYGVFNKDVYINAFDDINMDIDSDVLFLAKLFLNKYKIVFVNTALYNVRIVNQNSIKFVNPISAWVNHLDSQIQLYQELNRYNKNLYLKLVTLDSCFNRSAYLLTQLYNRYRKNAFEYYVINKICKHYHPIYKLRITDKYNPNIDLRLHYDNARLRCKILINKVLPYIETVVQDDTPVKNAKKKLYHIKKEIITHPAHPYV